MKKNLPFWAILVFLTFCLPNFASAAPNLVGVWKGTARKVTEAACPAPVSVTLTLSQCLVGTAPGNLFKGTVKVGTAAAVKIVGRINPDSTFEAHGYSLTTSTSAILAGKYLPAKGATRARLQILGFSYNIGASQLNEMYDIITLQK